MKSSIYEYRNASRFLLDRVVERQKADRGFSIRKWAKEMGFPSHSLLAMILQGKRNLTLRQVPFLAKGLNLSTPEQMYFQGLVQVENARTPEEKQWSERWLAELKPIEPSTRTVREVDEYLAIADWIHPALLALSDTQRSYGTAEEAHAALGTATSLHEIRAAIARLVEMKLLEKRVGGKYRATNWRTTCRDDVANRGGREYHKQVTDLAKKAVEAQGLHEREFQSAALSIPSSKIGMAKEMIRRFRTQFSEAMSSEPADQVYQLNLHFFRLTECPSKLKASKEDEGADLFPKHQGVPHEVPVQ